MKYTTDQMLSEILRRSNAVADRRNRRRYYVLSAASGILLAALVAVTALLPGWTDSGSYMTKYGAFLLSEEAGGYVLAAVLAFSFGVAVTIGCLYLRRKSCGHHEEADPPVTEMTTESVDSSGEEGK